MTSSRRALAVSAVALSSLVAACGNSGGNGEDAKSADQIVSDAKAALASATSYHIVGNVTQSGSTTGFDIKVDAKDTAAGHLSSDGVGFDFVSVGGAFYVRGKALIAKFAPAAVDVIGDKWVTATGNSDAQSALSGVAAFADAGQLSASLGSSGGPYTKGSTKTVDGQQVIAVNSKDGELDVALNGKPYPVHLQSGSNKIDVSEYGSHFNIAAPSGALDASALQSTSSRSDTSTSTDTSSKQVVDAAKVRDGVLLIAKGTITSSSGSASDAWGVAAALAGQLPSTIDVSVQSGSTSGLPPATPTKVILYTAETSSGDLFMVVVADVNGTCDVGALTGNPPNGNPQSKTLPAGTDCTAENGLNALQS